MIAEEKGKMKELKRFLQSFEDDMAAAAFAEAGEFETAREILRKSGHSIKEGKGDSRRCEDEGKEAIATPVKI